MTVTIPRHFDGAVRCGHGIRPEVGARLLDDNAHDDRPVDVASYRHGTLDSPPRWPDWAPEALTAL